MRLAALLFATSLLAAPVLADQHDDRETYAAAAAAYQGGDHEAALVFFTGLAESGVIAAQENLAHMYVNGEGAAADTKKALYWLNQAAEGGSIAARIALGAFYFHGDGVEADPVVAYAWFSLASHGGPEDEAMSYLYKIAEQLSPQDIDRARVLARQMHERFGLAAQTPAS